MVAEFVLGSLGQLPKEVLSGRGGARDTECCAGQSEPLQANNAGFSLVESL